MSETLKAFLPARCRAALLLAAALSFGPAVARAQEAAAVLSKGSGLYFETFLAFQKALGRPITAYDLARDEPDLPRKLKAVVAFGSKAASYRYPEKTRVIYLLSPGYSPETGAGRFTKISVLPAPGQAIAAYKELQPGLKKLAVFFNINSKGLYLAQLSQAAKASGVEIIPIALKGPLEFPDKLRGLAGKIDAFWLFPEPILINDISLKVLAAFSCSNRIPYYAPSGGLSELGAAAAFAPSFTSEAAAAAEALEKALAGEALPSVIYVPRAELTPNEAFIKKCGLPVILPAPWEAR